MRWMSLAASSWLAISLLTAAAPLTLDVSPSGITLAAAEANAKNGGGGRGGNGGGGGQGGGNGGGNNGNNGKGSDNRSADKASKSGAKASPGVAKSLSKLQVRHNRGITEAIVNGRYIMRDARERIIINRQATASDRRRIEKLLR